MTTPNNQPTPPEGMRLLTPEEQRKRLPKGAMFKDDKSGAWMLAKLGFAFSHITYAIPITPTVPATGDTNEKGGESELKEWRPKDRLIAVPDPQDVSSWYIITESDQLHVASVRCIVAEGFAKGLVEAWNESLE